MTSFSKIIKLIKKFIMREKFKGDILFSKEKNDRNTNGS